MSKTITILVLAVGHRRDVYKGGYRTKEIIGELQWIDKAGNLNLDIPALKEAKAAVDFDHAEKQNASLEMH